jgi:viroplasmin and RNaseH domain-containing protein
MRPNVTQYIFHIQALRLGLWFSGAVCSDQVFGFPNASFLKYSREQEACLAFNSYYYNIVGEINYETNLP